MNFQQFRLAYFSFLFILKLCIFLAIFLWIKNTFQYFEDAKFFDLVSNVSKIEKNLDQIWNIAQVWLITTGWFIFKIIVLNIIGWTAKSLPVKSQWLIYWDNLGEISPVLGREITKHLRQHNTINFMNLLLLYGYSQGQIAFLKMHSKNPNTQQLFKKYDPYYEKDISANE